MTIDELKKWFVEMVLPTIKNAWENAKTKLFGENGSLEKIKEELQQFVDAAKLDVAFEDVELLTMNKIVEVAKQHIVPNSNEVVVFKTMKEDSFFVYIAYAKDRDLLPQEENCYVVIKADGLSKEVKELFAESEVVILK